MIKCENPCPESKFDGCCRKCPYVSTCPDPCAENPNDCGSSIFNEETALELFKTSSVETLKAIAALTTQKKALEEQEKAMKGLLYDSMLKYRIKKFESDVLDIVLIGPTTSTSIDGAKLKKKYPQIAEECSKVSIKSGYVRITLKEDKK